MPTAAELLTRHRPVLKYDSQESYFADSAAVWTDNLGNRLTAAGGALIAAAGGELALEFLGPRYPGAHPAATKHDVIANPSRHYREQARALHAQPAYANRMYGHAAVDGDGRLWLQYWFFYFYNDYNLIGGIIKAGVHEGDWEMIQIGLDRNDAPVRATYAQHRGAQEKRWQQVERAPGTQRPVVYVARGSHASYFSRGKKWTGHWFDHADGKRPTPELKLEIVDDDDPPWIHWPGYWGDTRPQGGSPLDSDSPRGPAAHTRWREPIALVEKAAARVAPAGAAPTPPPPPQVRAEWADGQIRIAYRVSAAPGGRQPSGLAVTINSPDEHLPPTTIPFEIEDAAGSIAVTTAVDPAHAYDIHVSAATPDGLASGSTQVDIAAAR